MVGDGVTICAVLNLKNLPILFDLGIFDSQFMLMRGGMSEIFRASDDENNKSSDLVVIGDGTEAREVSFQLLQGVYNELTGKSEKVKRVYAKLFRIHLADIEELHKKIEQICEQFQIKASNHSVVVYYLTNTKEEFTSFARFKLHCEASASAVESIYIKYNFLVVLPQAKKPQSYTVAVRLASKITTAKAMEDDFLGAPPRVLQVMGQFTGIAEVKYVDYVVARNFMTHIDDWFAGIPSVKENNFVRWIQNRPYIVPRAARLVSATVSGCVTLYYFSKYIPSNSQDIHAFGLFTISSMLLAYLVVTLSVWASGFVESAFEKWSEISYICISKGDLRAIEEAESENRNAILRGIIGTLATFFVSVVASIVANYLTVVKP